MDRYIGDSEIPLVFLCSRCTGNAIYKGFTEWSCPYWYGFGLPIIATRVGGLEESLGKYKGTSFISPMDPDELGWEIADTLSKKQSFEPPEELRWDLIAKQWKDLISRSFEC